MWRMKFCIRSDKKAEETRIWKNQCLVVVENLLICICIDLCRVKWIISSDSSELRILLTTEWLKKEFFLFAASLPNKAIFVWVIGMRNSPSWFVLAAMFRPLSLMTFFFVFHVVGNHLEIVHTDPFVQFTGIDLFSLHTPCQKKSHINLSLQIDPCHLNWSCITHNHLGYLAVVSSIPVLAIVESLTYWFSRRDEWQHRHIN